MLPDAMEPLEGITDAIQAAAWFLDAARAHRDRPGRPLDKTDVRLAAACLVAKLNALGKVGD